MWSLPDHFLGDLVAVFSFVLVVILLSVIGYKLIDWTIRGVDFDEELKKGNIAVGIVVATIILGIFYASANIVVAIVKG